MTTINDLPSLPASEETLDLSRDVAYPSTFHITAGDTVRIQDGTFAVFSGVVWSVTGENVTVMLRVFGHQTTQIFHWKNLKRVV